MADSLATYKQLRHVVVVDTIPRLPSGKVLRRTLRDEWTPALVGDGGRRLMDVRLSPEQQALRDSAAQVVDRLGPRAVGQLDDAERAEQARRGRRRRRAGASCGPPRTDGSPLASGVEVAIVAEELGRGLADAPFLGPTWPPSSGGWPAPRRPPSAETVVLAPGLGGAGPVRPTTARPPAAVAVDAHGASLGAGAGPRRRRLSGWPRWPWRRWPSGST